MAAFKFKTILGRGIALAIPVAIVLYVFLRITKLFEKAIAPAAQKFGIAHIWGELTLTIFAIILIIIIILLLGLLMQLSIVSSIRNQLESIILKFVPSLNQVKLMAADKLQLGIIQNTWKPVVLFYEAKYNAAFIIEENTDLITLFVCKETSLNEGEILITSKEEVKTFPVSYEDLYKCSKAFGKGYLLLINKS